MIQDKTITECAHIGARSRTKLFVLIACEESQAECIAFRELGHIAYSCDIQPCRKGGHPGWHINDDCSDYLKGRTKFVTQDNTARSVPHWDLIVAHPPCTYLCKMGSIHLIRHTSQGDIIDEKRLQKMFDAADFFRLCLNANAPYVAVENPIPMKRAGLPKPSFYACPSWFGVKYTKKTLYWVKNLPPLIATIDYPNPKCFVQSSRGKYRARTFPQLARAIAKQWSEYIISQRNKPL